MVCQCYIVSMFYKLDGKIPVPCTAQELGEWMEANNRTLACDTIDGITFSTIFLGIDHSNGVDPLVFETLIFEGETLRGQARYYTWEHAMLGHKWALRDVK